MGVRGEILALRRRDIPISWLKRRIALAADWAEVGGRLDVMEPVWVERDRAESDPSLKQPIPYVLLQSPSGKLAAYRRRGAEARLHGFWSLGIGGHVDREDEAASVSQTIMRGASREVAEEVRGRLCSPRFLGVINEEETPVGRVHLGMVFVCRPLGGSLPTGRSEPGALTWIPSPVCSSRQLEIWSLLALELLTLQGGTGHRSGEEAWPGE